MKEKIKNQRGAGKIIPLHSKFTEPANDAGRDTEVLYGSKKGRRYAVPNWCDVEYKCVGDPKEVRSLHKVLKYMDKRKTTIIENGFGKWWLGNLVERLDGDWTTFNCRGEITGYRLDSNVLTINHYTAWCEQSGLRENIERTFPSVKVYYRECDPQTVSVLPMRRLACIFRNLTAWPPLTTNQSFS